MNALYNGYINYCSGIISYNHYYIDTNGNFNGIDNTNYDGRASSAMVFTEELGTILIGGYVYATSTYLATVNQLNTTNVSIPPLNIARCDHSARYYEGHVYVVGGDNGHSLASIEVLNLQNLEWQQFNELQRGWLYGNIQIQNNLMFVFGYSYKGGYNNNDIEIYDLNKQESVYYQNVFDYYNYYPASFINSNQLVVFGGDGRSSSKFERAPIDQVASFQTIQTSNLPSEVYNNSFSLIGWD